MSKRNEIDIQNIEMSQAVSSPPLVNADLVPNELNCPICFGVPTDPRLLPCEHIFCSSCITQAISSGSQSCPMCRNSCSSQQIRAISRDTAIYRIWSNIQVRCSRHDDGCNWTGCIVDFTSHSRKCTHVKQVVDRSIVDKKIDEAVEKNLAPLKEEVARLRRSLKAVKRKNTTLVGEKSNFELSFTIMSTRIQALESENAKLKSNFETTLNTMKSKIQALEGENTQLKQNTVSFGATPQPAAAPSFSFGTIAPTHCTFGAASGGMTPVAPGGFGAPTFMDPAALGGGFSIGTGGGMKSTKGRGGRKIFRAKRCRLYEISSGRKIVTKNTT